MFVNWIECLFFQQSVCNFNWMFVVWPECVLFELNVCHSKWMFVVIQTKRLLFQSNWMFVIPAECLLFQLNVCCYSNWTCVISTKMSYANWMFAFLLSSHSETLMFLISDNCRKLRQQPSCSCFSFLSFPTYLHSSSLSSRRFSVEFPGHLSAFSFR